MKEKLAIEEISAFQERMDSQSYAPPMTKEEEAIGKQRRDRIRKKVLEELTREGYNL